MGNQFASGKIAWGICDRCGFQYLLKELKRETVKQKRTGLLVCQSCWNPEQPQLMLGTFPISDPQALRDPRVDTSYITSGPLANGSLGEGSRNIYWGWNPVGGGDSSVSSTPNPLAARGLIGIITVTT